MKAVVLTRYGPPDVLELKEIERPVPGSGEILVRVRASAINDWEWGLVRGKPAYMRAIVGLWRPKVRIPGCDMAGRVEACGEGVGRFRPGDDVYGDLSASGFGAFAEYVCVPETSVAPMPKNLDYEQAAALPHAGMLAWQALYDVGRLDRVKNLLINGAGGGVGPIGLQLARAHGVEVTGVDSSSKQDFLRSLGFDHVVDYTREDFTAAGVAYDLILDVKTDRSPFAYARALAPGGRYVTVGGAIPRLLQCQLLRKRIARSRGRHVQVLALEPNKGLEKLTAFVEAGTVAPVIDRTYPLSEAVTALERFGEATQKGKIVLRVS